MADASPTFPKLAGQDEGYLLKQLKDFKSGARVDGIMKGLVASLTEKEMANFALILPFAASPVAKVWVEIKVNTVAKISANLFIRFSFFTKK
jgi:cytochrome c553